MNSPSCTIPSRPPARSPRGAAVPFLAAAALLCACGGSKPAPQPSVRAGEEASASPDPAKGQGVVTFRYSNKSTDANLQVDLGATDISLEMTGRPAEAMREAAAPPARPAAAEARKAPAPAAEPEAEAGPAPRDEEARAERKPLRKQQAKAPSAPKPGTPDDEEEEPGAADGPVPQDVTDKVLLGIRKAQEFFYQKRYPEALQMVRSSLEARPTAEGHALAGSVHYMMGATGLARRHWQQALRLNPDMPAVVNMLEKIATPGGRGSPHPRPLAARRNAAAPSPSVLEAAGPLSEPPFPDEVADPIAPPQSSAPAPAPAPAPNPPAPAAPKPAPVPVPASSAAPEAGETDAQAADEVAAARAPAAPAPAQAPVPAPAAPAAAPAAKPKFPQKVPAKAAPERSPAGPANKDKSP